MDEVVEIEKINPKNEDDLLYDVNIAKAGILKWLQHIRHVQQNKANEESMDRLSNSTALWIRDFCQKVLPMKFREGQCDYFGKKGMTLHVDVFLMRNGAGVVKKATYFTAAFRSDQDFQDSLSLADYVLRQFSADFQEVKELYGKSDNVGCYHCKVCPESIYKICKAVGITLKRLDFNEPQKGKDQCDRDSAVARSVLRSYVDEGNNVLSAEDIFTALVSSSMNDTKVSVVSFKKDVFNIACNPIDGISIYHSFEFSEANMKMWRYFNIGPGVSQNYSKHG